MSLQRRLTLAHLGVAVAAVLGMLAASAAWILLTPQQQWVVYPQTPDTPQGQALSLPLESYYRFTSIAFFALGAVVVGIVLGVAAWQIRFARGTPMVLTLVGSLAAGSAIGLLAGHLIRNGVDPAVVAANGVATPTLVEMPASISRWAIVIAPGIAAVLYAFTAAWHSDPDLGRPQIHRAPEQWVSVPVAGSGDPITAPIAIGVGAGRPSGAGVLGGPAAADAPGAHPTAGFGVSPADGTPRTDPSPGTR